MFDRNYQSRQNEFNAEFNADTMNVDMDVNMNQGVMPNMGANYGPMMGGTTQAPIIEPLQERQIHRTIMHDVPQE